MQELENLIPCELCNSLISIDDYSNHLSMCQNPPPNIPFSSNPYLVNNILTMSNLINNRNLSNINQIIIPPEEPCINSDAESGINSAPKPQNPKTPKPLKCEI